MNLHFATCGVWDSGDVRDCDCRMDRGWAIKKDPSAVVHPWRIYRRDHEGDLLPLMGAASHEAAVRIVAALLELRTTSLKENPHAW